MMTDAPSVPTQPVIEAPELELKFGVRKQLATIARQLRELADKVDTLCAKTDGKPELGTRAWLGLQNHLGTKNVTPKKVAKLRRCELFREPNIGRVTVAEIERWLEPHGLTLKE